MKVNISLLIGLFAIFFCFAIFQVTYAQTPEYAPPDADPNATLLGQIQAQNEALTGDKGAKLGGGNTDLRIAIALIIKLFLGFLGTLAIVYVTYGGFLYLTSGGAEDRLAQGKKIILYGLLGLIIALSSYSIAWFVYKLYYRGINDPFTTPGYGLPWGKEGQYYEPETQQMYEKDPLGSKTQGVTGFQLF